MTWRDDYFPLPARHVTWCLHCPHDIEPGDAMVKRPGESQWSHLGCAKEADAAEEEGDELERHSAAFHRMRRRVYRDQHGRRRRRAGLRPLKRKQRVPV